MEQLPITSNPEFLHPITVYKLLVSDIISKIPDTS